MLSTPSHWDTPKEKATLQIVEPELAPLSDFQPYFPSSFENQKPHRTQRSPAHNPKAVPSTDPPIAPPTTPTEPTTGSRSISPSSNSCFRSQPGTGVNTAAAIRSNRQMSNPKPSAGKPPGPDPGSRIHSCLNFGPAPTHTTRQPAGTHPSCQGFSARGKNCEGRTTGPCGRQPMFRTVGSSRRAGRRASRCAGLGRKR